MLFKFKSKSCGDLIMLEEGGKLVLTLIGKDPQPQGILEVSDMARSIKLLEAVIQVNGVGEHAAPNENTLVTAKGREKAGADSSDQNLDPVTIKQRVIPFLEMLKTCQVQGNPIVWGV